MAASAGGLSDVCYVQINVAGDAPAAVRLDSVFAHAAAVPEPAVLDGLLAAPFAILSRRRQRFGH